jgi:hypothetical protein
VRKYHKPGAYTVKFRIEDLDGGVATAEDTVAIGNRPPTSSFVVLPSSPIAGVKFNVVSTSTDPDTALTKWLWDLNGDGQYGDAEGPNVEHTFPAVGTYTIGLKVLDSEDVADVSTQSVTVQPPPPPAPAPAQPSASAGPSFRLLSPFPVVRVAGRIGRRGTKLRLLSVDAPPGARVIVVCRGRSCPFRSSARSARTGSEVHAARILRFRSLERKQLKAGVVVTIYITKPGLIGKFTQFRIRKGKPPTRIDSCLAPGTTKQTRCPG